MSYGQVARLAGYPRHARMVSKAMARSAQALPWHRVVKSDLRLAFAKGSEAYEKQKSLLIKEGIEFVNGKISGHHRDDEKTLDEWLWGPPA